MKSSLQTTTSSPLPRPQPLSLPFTLTRASPFLCHCVSLSRLGGMFIVQVSLSPPFFLRVQSLPSVFVSLYRCCEGCFFHVCLFKSLFLSPSFLPPPSRSPTRARALPAIVVCLYRGCVECVLQTTILSHRKLADNFSHESDVMSLQDLCTSPR